jgi:signal transduction histidine kinase
VKAVLTLRRPEAEPPFEPEDPHRAGVFAQHVAPMFLLRELAESRVLLGRQVEQLEDLNRLKDEFVANVSHELRTPLTAIIGNVMTVAGLGDMLGADDRRELLMAAERQAKRLAELLENLLAQSRLIGEAPAVVPVPVDVGAFVEEVGDTLRFRAPDRTIEVRATGRLHIATDRTLLYRILFNLGDNALKYSDGPIKLAARREEGGVRIDVEDRGVGIAPEDIPRIFEQFEQLDGSSSRRVGGVGLGLHLCARATAALGGRIEVDSTPGEGSTFSVWLPNQTPKAEPATVAEPS